MAASRDVIVRRAGRAYELARLKQAALDALPGAVLATAMVLIMPGLTNVLLGVGVVAGSVLFRWRGRYLGRGVGPGLALGWIPLFMPKVSSVIGHVCTAGQCVTWCGAACATGGLVSGLLLARVNARANHHPATWAVSSVLMVAASVAGCHCIGLTSLVAFVASLALSAVSGVWLWGRPQEGRV